MGETPSQNSLENYYFIAPLEFLELNVGKDTCIPIMPGLFFRTDVKAIVERFGEVFIKAAGALEHESLLRTKVVAYGECPKDSMPEMHPEQFIFIIYLWLRPFLRSLWLIKDHSINVGNSFAISGLV